jgi:hypothetical protein
MFRPMSAALLFAVVITAVLTVPGCAPVSRGEVVRLQQQIEGLLALHTSEYRYRDLVYFGEERTFLGLRTVDRAVLFAVDIRVRAGTDLQRGVELRVRRSSPHRVAVTLPPATILSVDSDETSIREYFIREQGKRIGLLEVSDQIERAKSAAALEAVRRGILDEAEANARRLIGGLLSMAGFRDIVFLPSTAGWASRAAWKWER